MLEYGWKRLLSGLLALMLVVGMLPPAAVWAEDVETEPTEATEIVETTEAEETTEATEATESPKLEETTEPTETEAVEEPTTDQGKMAFLQRHHPIPKRPPSLMMEFVVNTWTGPWMIREL